MVKIDLEYTGDLHCEAVHGPSGARVQTDAPVDNGGKGSSFSPTDLVATALGGCMATIMGLYAARHDIDLKGMKISVTKEMSVAPRRIARLIIRIEVPVSANSPHTGALVRAAEGCPVHKSLHPEIEKPIEFIWQD